MCAQDQGFFPKKDMMFPCPGLPPPFLAVDFAAGAILGFLGAGSSSEKDSHAGSSRVTISLISELVEKMQGVHAYQGIPPRL